MCTRLVSICIVEHLSVVHSFCLFITLLYAHGLLQLYVGKLYSLGWQAVTAAERTAPSATPSESVHALYMAVRSVKSLREKLQPLTASQLQSSEQNYLQEEVDGVSAAAMVMVIVREKGAELMPRYARL